MRILFIGDIVGRCGRTVVIERLPGLIRDWKLDLVVINGENAAGGFGITEAIYQELLDAGADAITLGNHAWDQREALVFIERAPKLIRPLNYPAGTPGRGAALIDAHNGARVLVINAMGRIFMDPLDDPFASIERELAACALQQRADAIVIDVHAEATSEKQAMGYFCRRPRQPRGRHPHPRSDGRPSHPARRHRIHVRRRHDRRLQLGDRHGQGRAAQPLPAQNSRGQIRAGDWAGRRFAALAVETDDATGLARSGWAVRLGGRLEEAQPAFWE